MTCFAATPTPRRVRAASTSPGISNGVDRREHANCPTNSFAFTAEPSHRGEADLGLLQRRRRLHAPS
jgi:hypothetical protein